MPKSLAIRPSPRHQQWQPCVAAGSQQRTRTYANSAKDLPKSPDGKGPNMDQLPHVSEEAAATKGAMGEEGPDMSQGTPVQEVLRSPYDAQYEEYAQAEQVLKDDKDAQKHLPKVMKDDLKSGAKRPYSTLARRHYSTSARRLAADLTTFNGNSIIPHEMIYRSPAYAAFVSRFPQKEGEVPVPALTTGPEEITLSKEDLPEKPFHQHRYEPIVEQVVGLLIRHGKKSVAQRNVSYILAHLRTSPPPTISERHPLMPGSPAPAHLPLNPILYLQLAIDSIAPLLRIKNIRGAAGGGQALALPMPLGLRQRRRIALKWILDSASKKKDRGSGKTGFAQRVAEEVIAVIEGRSSVWERRNMVHKQGVAARANMNARVMRKR